MPGKRTKKYELPEIQAKERKKRMGEGELPPSSNYSNDFGGTSGGMGEKPIDAQTRGRGGETRNRSTGV